MNREVVVVDAVRSPFGKRNGSLSDHHPAEILSTIQAAVFDRVEVDPHQVDLVIGGCVGQVGMQAMNVARTAWLTAGLPLTTPATTIDTQCGSSQQATSFAFGMLSAGAIEVALACGVESMSGVPMGSSIPTEPSVGHPAPGSYGYEWTSQFEGAERLADKYGISRSACDEMGKLSQDRAAAAWAARRFDSQVVPVGSLACDEGPRATTLEGLAGLKPTGRPNGVHTAGTSSQISDGASAVLMMTRDRARDLGLDPLATIVDVTLVGCDPEVMLEGPIPATRTLLDRNRLTLDDIDVVEINEAFAAVPLAWQRELSADMDRVNPNGGAIALGHPLGATGAALVAKAVHELVRADMEHALVTMCCGGGLGTGTLLRRC